MLNEIPRLFCSNEKIENTARHQTEFRTLNPLRLTSRLRRVGTKGVKSWQLVCKFKSRVATHENYSELISI